MPRSETIAKLAKAIAADPNLVAAMQVVPRQTLKQIEGLTPDERSALAGLDAGTLQAIAGSAVLAGRTPISPFGASRSTFGPQHLRNWPNGGEGGSLPGGGSSSSGGGGGPPSRGCNPQLEDCSGNNNPCPQPYGSSEWCECWGFSGGQGADCTQPATSGSNESPPEPPPVNHGGPFGYSQDPALWGMTDTQAADYCHHGQGRFTWDCMMLCAQDPRYCIGTYFLPKENPGCWSGGQVGTGEYFCGDLPYTAGESFFECYELGKPNPYCDPRCWSGAVGSSEYKCEWMGDKQWTYGEYGKLCPDFKGCTASYPAGWDNPQCWQYGDFGCGGPGGALPDCYTGGQIGYGAMFCTSTDPSCWTNGEVGVGKYLCKWFSDEPNYGFMPKPGIGSEWTGGKGSDAGNELGVYTPPAPDLTMGAAAKNFKHLACYTGYAGCVALCQGLPTSANAPYPGAATYEGCMICCGFAKENCLFYGGWDEPVGGCAHLIADVGPSSNVLCTVLYEHCINFNTGGCADKTDPHGNTYCNLCRGQCELGEYTGKPACWKCGFY